MRNANFYEFLNGNLIRLASIRMFSQVYNCVVVAIGVVAAAAAVVLLLLLSVV